MHQKCSNYILTNLLFGLCRSVWIIDSLDIHPSPHPGASTCPSTLEMLWAKEHTSTLYPSIVFIFRLVVESIKKFGVMSTFVIIHAQKNFITFRLPHYVWWTNINLITIILVTEFSIIMSLNWVTKIFWSPTFRHHN
jgi:hypothetical protein